MSERKNANDKFFEQRERVKALILEALKAEPLTSRQLMNLPGFEEVSEGVMAKAIEHLIIDGLLKKTSIKKTRSNPANFVYSLKERNLLDEIFAPKPNFYGRPSVTNLIDVDPYFGGSGLSCGIVKTGIQSGFAMMDLYGFEA